MALDPLTQTQTIVYLLIMVMTAIPAWFVLRRIGFSPFWALLCFVPAAALAGLWALAFMSWPHEPGES